MEAETARTSNMQGVLNWVVSKLGFFPPRPPTYSFIVDNKSHIEFSDGWRPDEFGVTMELFQLNTPANMQIASIFIKHFRSQGVTLLFSHGNAVDLGLLRDHLLALSCELQVNVFAYDYSGFGASTGIPTETNVYHDIDTSFHFLTTELEVPRSKVVLYGQSIGTAPTMDLASRIKDLRGAVLHSPFQSGARVFFPEWRWYPVDVFANCDKTHRVCAPVLIMHGLNDEIIDINQAMALHRALGHVSVMPLFIAGAGHNNMECYPEYALRLREFLEHVEACQLNKTVVVDEAALHAHAHPAAESNSKEEEGAASCVEACTPNHWCSSMGFGMFSKIKMIEEQQAPRMQGGTGGGGGGGGGTPRAAEPSSHHNGSVTR